MAETCALESRALESCALESGVVDAGPCGGVDALGECRGGMLRACVGGVATETDCAAAFGAGFSCVVEPPVNAARCAGVACGSSTSPANSRAASILPTGPGSAATPLIDFTFGHLQTRVGVPAAVVRRAGSLLTALEKHGGPLGAGAPLGELPLFAIAQPTDALPVDQPPDPLRDMLSGIDPDAMTPREALEALYRLKAEAG